MGKYNYTNRVELLWNVNEDERDILILIKPSTQKFYIFLNQKQIEKKILYSHPKINKNTTRLYCEIYRGAFRKEILLGTLNDTFFDKISDKDIKYDDRIKRDLEEIDHNRVSFRLIISDNNHKILGSSNTITPTIIGEKEEISTALVQKNKPLFGTKIDPDLMHPWTIGFDGDNDEDEYPVILLSKKFEIHQDMEGDNTLAIAIFSMAFKELLRRCISKINNENEYINQFIKYAELANDVKIADIIQDQNSADSEIEPEQSLYSDEVEKFIQKATDYYVEEQDFLKKYQIAKELREEKED